MDTPIINGIRINPAPMQGGVNTIQQAIYQSHGSDCGQNLVIFEPVGVAFLPGSSTPLRFIDLKEILDFSMNTDNAVASLENLQTVGTEYCQTPSRENRARYLFALQEWAQTIFSSIPSLTITGYDYRFTVYDSNGMTIFDSQSPTLLPITQVGPSLEYTTVALQTPNPFTDPDNPPPGKTSIQLYGIAINPGYLAYTTSTDVQTSAFAVSQAGLPENTMAIGSLLTDPANTRTYGYKYYGFSARQQAPNYVQKPEQGQIGYYAAYLNRLFTIPNSAYPKSTLIEYLFVRLGLEQSPVGV